MALGTPANVTTATGTTVAVTTSGFTVAVGSTIYVAVYATLVGSVSSLTIGSTPSLTWTQVTDQLYDSVGDGGTLKLRFQLWRVDSTGVSTTVTITPGATPPGIFGIQVLSIAGASPDVSNTGWDTDAAGDPAPSLTTAPDATSTVIGFFGDTNTVTATAPANYTELNEFFTNPGGGTRTLETVYDEASAAQSATWSTTATFSFGALAEVKAASDITVSGTATVSGVGRAVAVTGMAIAGSAALTGIARAVNNVTTAIAGLAALDFPGAHFFPVVFAIAGRARTFFTPTVAFDFTPDTPPGEFDTDTDTTSGWTFTRDVTPDPWN